MQYVSHWTAIILCVHNPSMLLAPVYWHMFCGYRFLLQASIFGVPIFPWMVYGVLVAFTFSLLLLFQLGIYNFSEYL